MKMIEVASSMVAAVGYDEETRTLQVQFNSGDWYEYYEVESEVFQELLGAESKGRYMSSNIIDCYDYYRIKRKRGR